MTDTINLGLPYIDAAQAQKHVTHNEALRILDTLVQLAVLDRDLATPPGAPSGGQRWLVAASPTGAWVGHTNHIAAWQDGAWQFSVPRVGWVTYVIDEGALLAWNGTTWTSALSMLTTLQNIALLGVGTAADSTNPFSAKLNNALWLAKTVAEGGDGNLRYKLSKESASKALSFLFQDNFSGRAEVGLLGDDDFHFKVSPDGSAWTDALLIDRTTGATKINAAFSLTGDIPPAQITANQNDYNPTGLSTASVLRLNTDASRNITGLQGGARGRIITIFNVGSNNIVLPDANASSSAANRFSFGADVTIGANQSFSLLYDATSSRWRALNSATVPSLAGGLTVTGAAAGVTVAGTTSNGIVVTGGHGTGQGSYIAFTDDTPQNIAAIGKASVILGSGTSSNLLINVSSSQLDFAFAGGTVMSLTGSALSTPTIGIGTTAPGAPLHIQGTNSADLPKGAIIMSRYFASASDQRSSAIYMRFNSATATEQLVFGVTGGADVLASGQIRMVIDQNANVGIGVTAFGTSAAKVLGMANATAPSSSPAGMGQLWVEGGALKYRGSSGTVTTVATA
jgi:hypothetical protein